MTRSLTDVYESARLNAPAAVVPDRSTVLPWRDLDELVRDELEVLQGNILSVLSDDTRLLAAHHRVIAQFNRGLRSGFFDAGGGEPDKRDPTSFAQQPYQWGARVGQQARGSQGALAAGGEPRTFTQFITATHLLAHEFGQLDKAHSDPFGFLRREVGPHRARDLGELVFALPVLLNYRADRVREVLAGSGFEFGEYRARLTCAPTQLEYLEHGLIALLDPREDSWIEVAACLGLATESFADGQTVLDEDHNAPLQAALAVVAKPITACTIVRQQFRRIELARKWTGKQHMRIESADDEETNATLWDVFELMPCAAIRGGEQRRSDLVAYELVRALADHLERNAQVGASRFSQLRRHLPAFARGFDERFEAALDARAIGTARIGAQVGEGLRRFASGERYVDTILSLLLDLDKAIRDLEHAAENPVDFAHKQLSANPESPISATLVRVMTEHPHMARELFQEHPEADFFSSTSIQTGSAFDLLRSALFHAIQSQSPYVTVEDDREEHRVESRRHLQKLVERSAPQRPANRPGDHGAPSRYSVVLTREGAGEPLDEQLDMHERAHRFLDEFESLMRVLKGVLDPLHVAFRLRRRMRDPGAGLTRVSGSSTGAN